MAIELQPARIITRNTVDGLYRC